jgi:hypothetical protein
MNEFKHVVTVSDDNNVTSKERMNGEEQVIVRHRYSRLITLKIKTLNFNVIKAVITCAIVF